MKIIQAGGTVLFAGDFDNDGDMDYIVGNLGLNTNYCAPHEPMTMVAKDFDKNGLMDPLVFCYMNDVDGSRKFFQCQHVMTWSAR